MFVSDVSSLKKNPVINGLSNNNAVDLEMCLYQFEKKKLLQLLQIRSSRSYQQLVQVNAFWL